MPRRILVPRRGMGVIDKNLIDKYYKTHKPAAGKVVAISTIKRASKGVKNRGLHPVTYHVKEAVKQHKAAAASHTKAAKVHEKAAGVSSEKKRVRVTYK